MPPEQIERLVRTAFPDAELTLIDTAGDQDHYDLTVASNAFAGKTKVAQHRMVYEALQGNMGGVLHALKLTTKPR